MGSPNIELISAPPLVTLLEDGLRFVVQSNRNWNASSASINIFFPNDQTAFIDKFFELTFADRVLKFYFRSNPDQSGLELNYWDISLTYEEFLSQVEADLRSNYFLSKHYGIYAYEYLGDRGIALTAHNSGSTYNLSLSSFDIINLDLDSNISGYDSEMPSDYKIYFAPVLAVDGLSALPLGEDLSPINESNLAETDLQEYLRYKLKSSFVYPSNSVITRVVEDACIKMFVRYGEFEDNTVKLMHNTFSTDLYVLNGGLSQLDKEFLKLKGFSFWGYDVREEKFLTWSPNPKVTFPGAPERLYFLKTQSANIKLWKTKVTSSASTTTEVKVISDPAYSVLEIACGLDELFPSEPDTILSYEVWLTDLADVAISEVRVFTVDNQEYLNKRSIFFRNSLGMYETICCTGDLTISDNIQREEFQILKEGVFKRSYSLVENIPEYKLSSGWLQNLEARKWLNELLISKDAFLTIGDMVLPIQITNGKMLNHKTRENLFSLVFGFEPDFRDSRYSTIATPEGGDFVLADEDWRILMDENGFTLLND